MFDVTLYDIKLSLKWIAHFIHLLIGTMSIYHMCVKSSLIEQFRESGIYYPPTYNVDGFIHCADDASSLIPIANNFYVSSSGEWICIKLDEAAFGDKLVYEAPAPVGNIASHRVDDGIKFPHIYAGIPETSVIATYPMRRRADGTFEGIVGLTILE